MERGIVVVAAAGNNGADGTGGLDLPAADPYVIAVGATDTARHRRPGRRHASRTSPRADAVRAPDVVAPGTGVVSLRVPGLDARRGVPRAPASATASSAAAAPHRRPRSSPGLVGAAAAAQRRELTPDQVKALLMAGAVDLAEPASADGAGRVDLARSLALPTPAAAEVAALGAGRPALDRCSGRRLPPRGLERGHRDRGRRRRRRVEAGSAEWAGRRWSGRRWSGMKWSGMKWSGAGWDAAAAG